MLIGTVLEGHVVSLVFYRTVKISIQ